MERHNRRLSMVSRSVAPRGAGMTSPEISDEEQAEREAAFRRSAGPGARTGLAELAYNNWSATHRGITTPPLLSASRGELIRSVQPGPKGLTDDDVRGFCARGFIVVRPKKPPEFHRDNFNQFERDKGSYGGSNQGYYGLKMQGLKAIFDDEAVQSTLKSLLGPGCVMHQHNGTHRNGPGSPNQSWHKDPYFHEVAVRHKHAFRICMALYYPQRTTLDIGPTGIIPGRYSHTHVSSTDCLRAQEIDQPLTVEAGSVVVLHGDTWHRAMVNYSEVLKFYFVRIEEPHLSKTGPTWDHDGNDEWSPVDGTGQDDNAGPATWRWLLGKSAVDPDASAKLAPLSLLLEDNHLASETQRIDAVFACASAAAANKSVAEDLVRELSSPATKRAVDDILLEAFSHSTNEFRGRPRHSKACNPSGTNPADLDLMHALAAAGASVLPVLLEGLQSDSGWWVRAAMAAAIGSLGPGSHVAAEALTLAVANDEDIWVRRNAAEALGYVLCTETSPKTAVAAVKALTAALEERDREEEFNYEQNYAYCETFRQAAALALARVVKLPAVARTHEARDALMHVCKHGVAHKLNTTTRWSAVVALDRLGEQGLMAEALSAMGWRDM